MSKSLKFERTLKAAPETVFAAWSTAEAMSAWFGPATIKTEVTEFDFVVGGSYRLVMKGTENQYHLSGQFIAIDEPRHLAFTWKWDDEDEVSRVEVGVEGTGSGTQLTVLHSGFQTDESVAAHKEGWEATWPCLDSHLA